VRLEEFGSFDEGLFSQVLAEMLEAHPDRTHVREVAERSPGLYVRVLEDGRLEVLLVDLDGSEVVVGKIATELLRRVPPMPPASVN
jgi:CRP-like cAMP-binding protein